MTNGMYNNGKPTLAYLSYPYSNDPIGNTKKARELAIRIMLRHPNIFIIVPHTAVDGTLFGEYSGVTPNHTTEDHLFASGLEYIILEKIDLLITGVDFPDFTSGMTWEYSYVLKLNRERRKLIDIKSSEEILK